MLPVMPVWACGMFWQFAVFPGVHTTGMFAKLPIFDGHPLLGKDACMQDAMLQHSLPCSEALHLCQLVQLCLELWVRSSHL